MSSCDNPRTTSFDLTNYTRDDSGGLDAVTSTPRHHLSHQDDDATTTSNLSPPLSPSKLPAVGSWDMHGKSQSHTYGGDSHHDQLAESRPRAESTLSALGIGSLFGDDYGRARTDSLGLGSLLGGSTIDDDAARPRADSLLSLGEESFTSFLEGGSSLGGSSTAAAAYAAASALHSTGLFDDMTAAAAAIDLPPSPDFAPSYSNLPDQPPMEELILTKAPVINIDVDAASSLPATNVCTYATPLISNASKKRARSDSKSGVSVQRKLPMSGSDQTSAREQARTGLVKISEGSAQLTLPVSNKDKYAPPGSPDAVMKEVSKRMRGVSFAANAAEGEKSKSHSPPLHPDAVSITAVSTAKGQGANEIEIVAPTCSATSQIVKAFPNSVPYAAPSAVPSSVSVPRTEAKTVAKKVTSWTVPPRIIPMSTLPPIIFQAGVLAALMVQDEVLLKHRKKKALAAAPPVKATNFLQAKAQPQGMTAVVATAAVKSSPTTMKVVPGVLQPGVTATGLVKKVVPCPTVSATSSNGVSIATYRQPVAASNSGEIALKAPLYFTHAAASASNPGTSFIATSSTRTPPLTTAARNAPQSVLYTPGSSVKAAATANRPSTYSTNGFASTASMAKKTTRGLGNQKWEEMLNCLKQYVVDKCKETPVGRTFVWDGHVPTNFKTLDGRALGRWVNNQRSAKTKGSLRKDREERLVAAGLKWSVLATSTWADMIHELKLYISDHSQNGDLWDGNVPTNYKIQSNTAADGTEIDEEKNLGRWVNRQRSLYHAERLRKERQLELEALGLRWSVLATPLWEVMFECLCDYRASQLELNPTDGWDGDVPPSHRTDESPPKSLGKWVQRQRSAYEKKNLKQERVEKLESIGFKWNAT